MLKKISPQIAAYIFPVILVLFIFLGLYKMGFNRSPEQFILMNILCIGFEIIFSYFVNGKVRSVLAAYTTSLSLGILLNYAHGYSMIFYPCFFAIASKYLIRYKGKHVYNPSLFAIVLCLLLLGDKITIAPAYQWNALYFIGPAMILLSSIFILPFIKRTYLVMSFLASFTLFTLLRGYLWQDFVPFDVLFVGTIFSPAFILFAFYMITDPSTSPSDKNQQIYVGILISFIDFLFHLTHSYYTFFYAAFLVRTMFWLREVGKDRSWKLIEFPRKVIVTSFAIFGFFFIINYQNIPSLSDLKGSLKEVPLKSAGITFSIEKGMLQRLDPQINHISKWFWSSIGGVAVGDINNDGFQDIFLTNSIQNKNERNALYLNKGEFKFERVNREAFKEISNEKKYDMQSSPLFVDYDDDGDLDIFLNYPQKQSQLLKNLLNETGVLDFRNITHLVGLREAKSSHAASFSDFNLDGTLDLIMVNNLKSYIDRPLNKKELDLFNLHKKDHRDDIRPYDIMPENWIDSQNGGENHFFLFKNGRFLKQDNKKWGLESTYFSLAVASSDVNGDGYSDIYIANDFGPDEFYLNNDGHSFRKILGDYFGSIGRDTYKGMNVTIDDFNNDLVYEIHVSNVHHPLMAEGNLVWTDLNEPYYSDKEGVVDIAESWKFLNEARHGWGANSGDLDLDGRLDMVQTNGQFDNKYDTEPSIRCGDYWYINEKVTRSPPSYQRNALNWGSMNNMCIMSNELDRIYLNKEVNGEPYFIDIASRVGFDHKQNTRAAALVDFDNDGRLDLFIVDLYGEHKIYQNLLESNKNWLGFSLYSKNSDCFKKGIGTTITLTQVVDGLEKKQIRHKSVINGHSAQKDERLHFGLGKKVGDISIEVNWCGKIKKTYQINSKMINRYNDLVLNISE